MNLLKNRLHRLIDKMSEKELETAWEYLENLYYDNLMLKAIEKAKKNQRPGDALTREEAEQVLYFYQDNT